MPRTGRPKRASSMIDSDNVVRGGVRMSKTADFVVDEFLKGVKEVNNDKIYVRDFVLYSYGPHFPLCVCKEGVYYVNMDRYSPSTSHQQTILRHGITITGRKWQAGNTEWFNNGPKSSQEIHQSEPADN